MKKLIIVLSCCTAFLLVAYVGYRGYKVWKREHLISMARGFIAKSDERNAILSLRQVLGGDSRNLEATRLMADLTSKSRSPSALLWRTRVVELNASSAQDRVELAKAALMFQDYVAATNALAGVGEADRRNVEYQNLLGAAKLGLGLRDDAKKHFIEASRLAPSDPVPQLNLNILRLHETNTDIVVEARSAIERIVRITTNGLVRCQGLRELIGDAARFQQTNTALSLSEQLVNDTNSLFSDRLARLNVLRTAGSSDFQTSFDKLQQQSMHDPASIYELATWQTITLRDPGGTLKWLDTLPTDLQTNLTIMILTADAHSMLGDWRGLQSYIERQNWHELEFMRHALKARALKGQDLSEAAKTEWEQASKLAGAQRQTLTMLLKLTVQWKWEAEAEELLWMFVNRYPNESWAAQTLTVALYSSGRTRPLMMLFNQKVKGAPSDLEAKNNLAVTALLLQANELKPHELAREVYQQAPTNATYASTYAFSLYLQKKPSEALKVMEQLTPQQLEKPSIAGYYGLILQAAGNSTKAKPYLEAASKAKLLPEERKLFEQAKAGV